MDEVAEDLGIDPVAHLLRVAVAKLHRRLDAARPFTAGQTRHLGVEPNQPQTLQRLGGARRQKIAEPLGSHIFGHNLFILKGVAHAT